MERLFELDLKDYDEDMRRYRRPSVRAIILRDGLVAMVHSLKYDYYKFPGGGIERGESRKEALVREVREEAGLSVLPETVKPFGSVMRIQQDSRTKNRVFEQENLYYFCEVADSLEEQTLDPYEAEECFTLEYVPAETAVKINRERPHGPKDQLMTEREARVLEILMERGLIPGSGKSAEA